MKQTGFNLIPQSLTTNSCFPAPRPSATMSKNAPDLKKFLEKRVSIQVNGNRKVVGTLVGFDQFMNLTIDRAVEETAGNQRHEIGLVVLRGNSVVTMESLDRM